MNQEKIVPYPTTITASARSDVLGRKAAVQVFQKFWERQIDDARQQGGPVVNIVDQQRVVRQKYGEVICEMPDHMYIISHWSSISIWRRAKIWMRAKGPRISIVVDWPKFFQMAKRDHVDGNGKVIKQTTLLFFLPSVHLYTNAPKSAPFFKLVGSAIYRSKPS